MRKLTLLTAPLALAAALSACVPEDLVRHAQNAEQAALMAAVDAELARARVASLREQLVEEMTAARLDQARQDAELADAVARLEERLRRMFEASQRK